MNRTRLVTLIGAASLGAVALVCCTSSPGTEPPPEPSKTDSAGSARAPAERVVGPASPVQVAQGPLPEFVEQAVTWLEEAQHASGGWGAGSHARQDLRNPHGVQTDPATTAFAGMALLRLGNTPLEGRQREAVRRATEYLCAVVEEAPEGARVTALQGTQAQAKLGALIDTSMTAQFLARVLGSLPAEHALRARVDAALDVCLSKLQDSQQEDGSWAGGGGWAPVLMSSMSCSALELAQAAGKPVDAAVLANARDYQKGNFDRESGRADASAGAGIELYSWASSQRATAGEARAAEQVVAQAKREGKLAADAEVNTANLQVAGVAMTRASNLADAYALRTAQNARLSDEKLLAGFGNNGGEEYLSYLLTSESLVLSGGEEWERWNEKMHTRLAKIQGSDGSWSGHHCITSPVFCTAAVVQCLTADRDAKLLARIAQEAAEGPG